MSRTYCPTQPVVIREVKSEYIPNWLIGESGSFNERLYIIIVRGKIYPAEGFVFEGTTVDGAHLIYEPRPWQAV
jgi:hypothetical protein